MAHTTYTVGPKPGNKKGWRVLANGRTVSKHNKKHTAEKKAKKLADRNDSITVKDSNGRFQKRLQG